LQPLPFFAYIVECADGSLYTGWTDDIERRIAAHNAGKGARYTRSRTPVRLLNHWEFTSKGEAMSFEWHVKQLTRKEKLDLAALGAEQFNFGAATLQELERLRDLTSRIKPAAPLTFADLPDRVRNKRERTVQDGAESPKLRQR
jgi:putative endonuclease